VRDVQEKTIRGIADLVESSGGAMAARRRPPTPGRALEHAGRRRGRTCRRIAGWFLERTGWIVDG
jgi:hypothetical protein